jgi:UDP-N-acetyl-2-amino-2-deoxyglucuronate dehydrogenase
MKFVIIGPGYISRRYVEKIAAMENACTVAVVGRNEDRTQQYAQKHGIPVSGTELKSVAKRSGAQSAIICTPNAYHHDAVVAAANLGLHCLCEKPLDISRQRQNEMIEVCRNQDVLLAVSYMHRFHKHLRYIKTLIESGALGRILVVDAVMKIFRGPEYYATSSWHGTREIDGGGPFIQQGSHLVDLVLWLAGKYEKVLDARRFNILHSIEVEDHGYAVIRFKNGAVGMIEVSTVCCGMNSQTLNVIGTKGHICADLERIISFEVEGHSPPALEPDEDLFLLLIADFIEAVESGRRPLVTGESAKTTTELILDIYQKAGPVIEVARGNQL